LLSFVIIMWCCVGKAVSWHTSKLSLGRARCYGDCSRSESQQCSSVRTSVRRGCSQRPRLRHRNCLLRENGCVSCDWISLVGSRGIDPQEKVGGGGLDRSPIEYPLFGPLSVPLEASPLKSSYGLGKRWKLSQHGLDWGHGL